MHLDTVLCSCWALLEFSVCWQVWCFSAISPRCMRLASRGAYQPATLMKAIALGRSYYLPILNFQPVPLLRSWSWGIPNGTHDPPGPHYRKRDRQASLVLSQPKDTKQWQNLSSSCAADQANVVWSFSHFPSRGPLVRMSFRPSTYFFRGYHEC